jgi:hypothetical protein
LSGFATGNGPQCLKLPAAAPAPPCRYEDEPAAGQRRITRTNSSDGSSAPLPECRTSPIQVSLPPGGKPVRVVLAVRPTRPGTLLLLGCQCSAWGMEWTQAFIGGKHAKDVPEGAKGLKGLEGPNGLPVPVTVLPALPTIRAALQGAEVQVGGRTLLPHVARGPGAAATRLPGTPAHVHAAARRACACVRSAPSGPPPDGSSRAA